MHFPPIYVGCHSPYLKAKVSSEFVCMPNQPVLEVIRILDLSWPMLLDGCGRALPRGAKPVWLTEWIELSDKNCFPFRNSKNELFVPCLN